MNDLRIERKRIKKSHKGLTPAKKVNLDTSRGTHSVMQHKFFIVLNGSGLLII